MPRPSTRALCSFAQNRVMGIEYQGPVSRLCSLAALAHRARGARLQGPLWLVAEALLASLVCECVCCAGLGLALGAGRWAWAWGGAYINTQMSRATAPGSRAWLGVGLRADYKLPTPTRSPDAFRRRIVWRRMGTGTARSPNGRGVPWAAA